MPYRKNVKSNGSIIKYITLHHNTSTVLLREGAESNLIDCIVSLTSSCIDCVWDEYWICISSRYTPLAGLHIHLLMCSPARGPTIGPRPASEVLLLLLTCLPALGFISQQPSPELSLKLTNSWDQTACQILTCVCYNLSRFFRMIQSM